MEKGRSNYNFQINCSTEQINNLLQSYLIGNNFKLETKNNETYYKAGDSFQGFRYFNYAINNNILSIYAWFKGGFGEIKVEQSGMVAGTSIFMSYRSSLLTLFNEIEKLNNGGNMNNNQMNFDPNTGQPINQNTNNNGMNFDPNTGQPINQTMNNNGMNYNLSGSQIPNQNSQQPMQYNSNQFVQTFQNETIQKQEKLCEVGFWLSIIGLLTSFVGITYGIIVYIMNFYFASQGLNTRKKGKAIATIIISIISILIIVFQIVKN